ncbi:MAG: hypothetical protein ACR2ID_03665 [Chthoniobacterales bacterium]
MKALFGSLMCLVLGATQSFAISGGPPYPGGGTNITGTYAGVLQGQFDPTNPASSNAIGVFSLGVPRTGISTGTFIMFNRGRVFTGTINGNGDPDSGSLRGILNATYNFNVYVPDATGALTTISVTASANGPINANVIAPRGRNLSTAATRVSGSAQLSINGGFVNGSGDPVISSILLLSVSGFKQADSA